VNAPSSPNAPNRRRARDPLVDPSAPEASAGGAGLAAGAPGSRPRPAPRWFAALRTAAGVALVAGTSIAVAWAARSHVMTSPRFAVSDVQVAGNDRRPADALIAESGIAVGANVFALDLDAARAKLLADPWIAEASLARRLPGTIWVQVVERRPAALVALGDTLLATADGEPFKKLDPGDPIELPLVTGLASDAFAADRDGAMRTVRRAIDLAAEYEHGPLAHHSPLEEVHVAADGSFSLVVGKSATQLVLGGPPFRRKLEQAARVVGELDKRGAKADAIMLDNDTRPERVVVRMR
jgi:cell division protein FtsQ